MKRLKFLMVFVFLLVGTLTVMSFTSDKYRKQPLAVQCLKWNKAQNPFAASEILNQANWDSMLSGNPEFICTGGEDLCAICFDTSNTFPSEARQVLYDYYRENLAFPYHGQLIVGNNLKVIQVFLKTIEE